MADAGGYKISNDVVEEIGLVVTLDEVQSYGALLDYDSTDEDVTVVIPSATCPEGDLKLIKEFCQKFDYSYQPPAAPDTTEEEGGSGKGNEPAKRDGEAGESSGKQP